MFSIWIQAIRPKTLGAALAPVLLGFALLHKMGSLQWLPSLMTLVGALLLQILSNLANDYFDHQKGADTEERTGPQRVMQAGLVTDKQMKAALAVNVLLTVLVGSYLVYQGGWPILMIGAFSLLFAFLYTAGPYPLAYLGLGDFFVFLFFGPIAVCGTYYVQMHTFEQNVFGISFVPGLLSTAILIVNNYRDHMEDRRNQKKTLIVRFGTQFGKFEYLLCLVFPFIYILYYAKAYESRTLLLPLLLLPFTVKLLKNFEDWSGPQLNKLLALTSLHLILVCTFLCIGILL